MIFSALAKFIKPYLAQEESILPLLSLWLKQKIQEKPASDHPTRLIQEAFAVQELSLKQFSIVPKNQKAAELLEFMKEYMQVMETTRFARWLKTVEPKDFQKRKIV
jgi:hypothetical protein